MRISYLFILLLSLIQVTSALAQNRYMGIGGSSNRNRESQPIQALEPTDLKGPEIDKESLMKVPEIQVEQERPAAAPAQQSTNGRGSDTYGAACVEATDSAKKECNFEDSPDAKVAIGMANMMRQQLKAATMSSVEAMCSKMGSITQAMDGAVAAFSGYCSTAYSSCSSACTSDIEELKSAIAANPANKAVLEERLEEVRTSSIACRKLAGNIQDVTSNIGSYAAVEAAKSQYCKEGTSTLAQICKTDPNNMLCKNGGTTNCADPNVAASSVVCICQANPADPRCGAQQRVGLQAGTNSNGASSGGGADGAEALGDFGGMGGDGIGGANGIGGNMDSGSSGSPRAGIGGGRGGGLGGGGGGSNGRAGAGSGGAGSNAGNGINAKILTGYGVGGATGAGARGGYGGPAGSGAGGPNRYGVAGGAGGKGVDLRKFLPGGEMDPSRGLAGVSGPDGITGPNTDIWKKIQMRYYSVSPSLLP